MFLFSVTVAYATDTPAGDAAAVGNNNLAASAVPVLVIFQLVYQVEDPISQLLDQVEELDKVEELDQVEGSGEGAAAGKFNSLLSYIAKFPSHLFLSTI